MNSKTLNFTFEEIYSKLNTRDFILVHIKESMESKLLHAETKTLFDIPDGNLEYDSNRYYRKFK